MPGLVHGCLAGMVCLPGVPGVPGLSGLGGVSGAVAGGLIDSLTSAVTNAAGWLIGHLMDMASATTTPDLSGGWFPEQEGRMASVAVGLVVPLLIAASIGPVLHQDARRLGRVWGVGLPLAVLGALAGAQLAAVGLSATDALCTAVAGTGYAQLGHQLGQAMLDGSTGDSPSMVQLAVATLSIAGGLMIWLELTVRSAAVLVAVFFMPLALAAYVWPVTARMTRRLVELLTALILSKFVIVAALSLGLAALGHRGLDGPAAIDSVMSGAAILLMAGFAPFALLRLAPVLEAAAMAHLEGMSHRPFRAAERVSMVGNSPVAQRFLGGRTGAGDTTDPRPEAVASQLLARREPDYRVPDAAEGGPDV